MAHPFNDIRGDKVAKSRVDSIAKGYNRGGPVKGGGKTNVNIIIAGQPGGDAPAPRPMMPPPVGGPAPTPPRPMPPMMPAGGGPPGLAPRPFKNGGRVNMNAGAGGGLGRLEKAKAARRGK